jgi:hypothetical protein
VRKIHNAAENIVFRIKDTEIFVPKHKSLFTQVFKSFFCLKIAYLVVLIFIVTVRLAV